MSVGSGTFDAVARGRATVWSAAVVAAALALSVFALQVVAPDYLSARGFPLDDSWIHAVYARELSRSATLAFNPGVPASGETSPLWAIVLAPLHAVSSRPEVAVALTKLAGLALHGTSVFLLAAALLRRFPDSKPEILFAAALAAGHPDLVAASVSGMEVPLATCVVAGIAVATLARSEAWLAAGGALAFAARPEAAIIAVLLPAAFWLRTEPKAAIRLAAAGLAGALLSLAAISVRNHAVTGMYLPATFHAKVHVDPDLDGSWYVLRSFVAGFADMLGYMPLFGFVQLTAVVVMTCAVLLTQASLAAVPRLGAALYLTGVAYCAVSFLLVEPIDPSAFYHQRYALPGVFLMSMALLLVVGGLVRLEARLRLLLPVAVVTTIAAIAIATPERFRRIANDAHNIDDVQVAMGRFLQTASPTDNAWVVDVGAARFFGRAFIVDVVGLNSPEMLGSGAQQFLDRHPPKYIDLFKSWSAILHADRELEARLFQTSTPYTVASFQPMREHVIVSCQPGVTGRVEVRRGRFDFRCQQ